MQLGSFTLLIAMLIMLGLQPTKPTSKAFIKDKELAAISMMDPLGGMQVALVCARCIKLHDGDGPKLGLVDALELVDGQADTHAPSNKAFWTYSVLQSFEMLHGCYWLLTELADALDPATGQVWPDLTAYPTLHMISVLCTISCAQNYAEEDKPDSLLCTASLGCSCNLGMALGLRPRPVLGCLGQPRSWMCRGGYLLHVTPMHHPRATSLPSSILPWYKLRFILDVVTNLSMKFPDRILS